jgi:hypothetical protein
MSSNNIESPLAQAMRQGTLGGKSANPPTEQKPEGKQPASEAKRKRKKQDVYIPEELWRWARIQAMQEDIEISEVYEKALQLLKSTKG